MFSPAIFAARPVALVNSVELIGKTPAILNAMAVKHCLLVFLTARGILAQIKHYYLHGRKWNMQIGEAVVSGASQGPKGAQEVEFKAVCSMANCERLNVIAGQWRAAVTLDRPQRGALCQFKVIVPAHLQLRLGDNLVVEFFYPGEQAGAHGTSVL
jgi:hypothetical protein